MYFKIYTPKSTALYIFLGAWPQWRDAQMFLALTEIGPIWTNPSLSKYFGNLAAENCVYTQCMAETD